MASPETDTLSRRERERLVRRQAILAAARAVFAEKGYENATLDEIAQRAEFGKGTLYNYFEGGKEDILFTILDELHDNLHAVIEDSLSLEEARGRSPRDAFHEFLESCLTFFSEREDLFMVLMKEAHQMSFSEDREQARYFQEQRVRLVNAIVAPLERARRAGLIKDMPLEAVAHLILGNINGIQTHLALLKSDFCQNEHEPAITTPREAADFLTTILWDGLAARKDDRRSAIDD